MKYLNKKQKNKVRELRKEGIDVWSISRLNAYRNCPYGYKLTYINGDRGKNNIYSYAGTMLHDSLESIYNGISDKSDLIENYKNFILKMDIFGIKFPNENIKGNWKSDIEHFIENFIPMNQKIITEKHFLLELEGIYLQGYIDAYFEKSDGSLFVIDWKSSSRFTGQALIDAGRQLLLYKLALEQNSGIEVSKVAWFMMKYVYVCYGNRRSMRNRRDWVAKTKNPIIKALKQYGEEDFVVELLISEAIENNNLDNLPQAVQDQFWLEDCILDYEVTEDRIDECLEYVRDTVKRATQDTEFKPVEINRGTEFFCNVLCNHRDTCKYLRKYRGEQVNELDNQVEKSIMDLFG